MLSIQLGWLEQERGELGLFSKQIVEKRLNILATKSWLSWLIKILIFFWLFHLLWWTERPFVIEIKVDTWNTFWRPWGSNWELFMHYEPHSWLSFYYETLQGEITPLTVFRSEQKIPHIKSLRESYFDIPGWMNWPSATNGFKRLVSHVEHYPAAASLTAKKFEDAFKFNQTIHPSKHLLIGSAYRWRFYKILL